MLGDSNTEVSGEKRISRFDRQKNEIERLTAINAELIEALEAIIKHQSFIAGNSTAALSGTMAIATAAIKKVKENTLRSVSVMKARMSSEH